MKPVSNSFWDDEEPEEIVYEANSAESQHQTSHVYVRKPWSTYFGPYWEAGQKFVRGMYGKDGKLMRAGVLLAKGFSIRKVMRMTGCSRVTIRKLRSVLVEQKRGEFFCVCGRNSGHQGWCHHRYSQSSARQRVMREMHDNQRRKK